jgi:hypothetical protein
MNKPPSELFWKVQEHFSSGKVTVTLCRTRERRSRCKRNKWKGPARSAESSPFMAACFLTGAERSAPGTPSVHDPQRPIY